MNTLFAIGGKMLRKTYVARAEIIIMVPPKIIGEVNITRYCGKEILDLEMEVNAHGSLRLHLSDCREISEEV